MSTEIREISIGAITVFIFLLVLGGMSGLEKLSASAPDSNLRLFAKFNKVDGLLEGDEVRMAGIKIGSVESAELDGNYRAILTFRLEQAINLPLDTSASIQTDGLFGSKFVVLAPGAEENYLKEGDEITYTQDALIVGELMEMIISEGKAAANKRNATQ